MTFGGWMVLIVIAVPLLGVFIWLVLRGSLVRVSVGQLGLLVVNGKPTDKSLVPGLHWVPALRRRQLVPYPAVELSYRAGDTTAGSQVEASGPPLPVVLGDRAEVSVGYTLRFRLNQEHLRTVHERFGTTGYWSAARDASAAVIAGALGEDGVGLDSFFPGERATLQETLREHVTQALADDGLDVTGFILGGVELGRAGEAIQAAVRARLELAREQAEAATQKLRVRNDVALAKLLDEVGDTALRYRQTEVWRELAHASDAARWALSGPALAGRPEAVPAAGQEPAPPTDQEEGRQ